jgi:hypothetical protein
MVYLQNKISISVNYEGLWMEISVYLELIILWQFWYIFMAICILEAIFPFFRFG